MEDPSSSKPSKKSGGVSVFFVDDPTEASGVSQDRCLSHRLHLSVNFSKSTPPQDRQLIVYYY